MQVIKLRVLIDDRPGMLSRVTSSVAASKGNILDVVHRRTSCDHSAKHANLDLTIEISKPTVLDEIAQSLKNDGFKVTSL